MKDNQIKELDKDRVHLNELLNKKEYESAQLQAQVNQMASDHSQLSEELKHRLQQTEKKYDELIKTYHAHDEQLNT